MTGAKHTALLKEYYLHFTDQLEMSHRPYMIVNARAQTNKATAFWNFSLNIYFLGAVNYPLAANRLSIENIFSG